MSAEKQVFQLSFLNPPLHNLEGFASFALPKTNTPTPTLKVDIKKILLEQNYWHGLPATPGQIIDIAFKSRILGMPEPQVANRMEARYIQHELTGALNRRDVQHKLQRRLKKSK